MLNGNGDLNMEKLVLFIVASGFEFGLGVFLFRDQIFGQTNASKHAQPRKDRKFANRYPSNEKRGHG